MPLRGDMTPQIACKLLTMILIGALSDSGVCKVRVPSMDDRQSQAQNPPTEQTKLNERKVITLLSVEFSGLFKLDEQNISPSYLVGDFNGDGVQDIAVSVRLNRQISPDDKSKSPFSFEKAPGPGPDTLSEEGNGSGFAIGDLARYQDLAILAIIHGSMRNDWNESQPEQRFVIVDAWHLGKKLMTLYRGKLKPTPYGDEPSVIQPPKLLGDAILMLDETNVGTAVYWDGARYRWYPVDELP